MLYFHICRFQPEVKMYSILSRPVSFACILLAALFAQAACGDIDSPSPEAPIPIEDTAPPPPNNPPTTDTSPPGTSPPPGSSTNNGAAQIVSATFFYDEENRFYTNLAHLLGRNINNRPLNFIDNIQVQNNSSTPQTVYIRAALQGYSETAQQRVDLAPNQTKQVNPMNLSFNYEKLYNVTSSVTSNIELSLYQNDTLIDLHSFNVFIDPINRFRWFREENGQVFDFRPYVAVLITPEDRENQIQRLLTEAAAYSKDGSIYGYQGGTIESAIDQVFAVYSAMQMRNIVYTNVIGSFFDGAQNVKLPAQSLLTGSANCIDGVLVFASAFEAMGMEPILVFMSGHALIGVRLSPGDDDSLLLIETTMVGNATFNDAVESAHDTVSSRLQEGDPLLSMLDLTRIRQAGIIPLNR